MTKSKKTTVEPTMEAKPAKASPKSKGKAKEEIKTVPLKKKIVKDKSEDGPKRPPNAYFLFTADVRASIKAANPTATVTDLTRLIAADYKLLPEAKRAEYNAKAKELSTAYKASQGKKE